MIDLHTHTIFSDGELIPYELVRRAEEKGYTFIALTDHLDFSNMDFVIPRIIHVAEKINKENRKIKVIPGCELTHIHPSSFDEAVKEARRLGAKIVVAHGETPVEPVAKGTNFAAINAGVDILAHPGLITEAEVQLAVKKGVFLEITARGGHNITNGHVVKLGLSLGANFVINTDAHAPKDLIDKEFAMTVAVGAGLGKVQFSKLYKRVGDWVTSLI